MKGCRKLSPDEINELIRDGDWFPYVETWSEKTADQMFQTLVTSSPENNVVRVRFVRSNFTTNIPDRMRYPFKPLQEGKDKYTGFVFQTKDVDLKDYREINAVGDFFMEDIRLSSAKRKFEKLTPIEKWDKERGKIVEMARRRGGPDIGPYEIRNEVFRYTHECNPFRPTIALAVYSLFNARTILDMSAGWGDRLIGAMAWAWKNPDRVIRYQGYDPFVELQPKYKQIISKFAPRESFVVSIQPIPFEEAPVEYDTFDLAFTSPPYFDFEEYGLTSEDDDLLPISACSKHNQSTVRYPQLEDWIDGFLKPTLRRASLSLKRGGFLVLNIEGPFVFKLLDKSSGDHSLFGNAPLRMDYQGIVGYKSDIPKDPVVHPMFVWRRTI